MREIRQLWGDPKRRYEEFASRMSRSWFPSGSSPHLRFKGFIDGSLKWARNMNWAIFYLKIYLRLYLISDDLPARSAIPTNMEARRENVPYLSRMTRQDLAHFKVQINRISLANWPYFFTEKSFEDIHILRLLGLGPPSFGIGDLAWVQSVVGCWT